MSCRNLDGLGADVLPPLRFASRQLPFKNGLDLGSNLFPYFNFWVHISGGNLDGLGADVLSP